MFTGRTITAPLPALLLLLSLSGCILDRDCDDPARDNLRLELRYTLDPGEESLPAEVGDIRLYVFDQGTGLLADILRIGEQDIRLGYTEASMPAGTYTFVAWADGGDDITRGGYTDAAMYVDVKVHRLEVDAYAERPVTLRLQDPDTGVDIVRPIDVMKTLLSVKGPDGDYLWRTQEDIDRQGEFDMEIAITGDMTDLDVSVTVEGYEVVKPGADIDRP